MINSFREIENSYIENFSLREEKGDHIIFRDERLPDMHAFNCTLVKENMNRSCIADFAANTLNKAKANGDDFLKMILHPQINITDDLEKQLQDIGFEIQTNLYMKIDKVKLENFKVNPEGVVRIAKTDEEYEAVRALDLETSIAAGMPAEFAYRKSMRKREVYRDSGNTLCSYLCHYDSRVIGKCEFFTKDGFAKMEDFDVLDRYQRRGFGTAMLKRMISDAVNLGMENIYLITGKEDTPREMYSKLGFEIIGEELELFWGK